MKRMHQIKSMEARYSGKFCLFICQLSTVRSEAYGLQTAIIHQITIEIVPFSGCQNGNKLTNNGCSFLATYLFRVIIPRCRRMWWLCELFRFVVINEREITND